MGAKVGKALHLCNTLLEYYKGRKLEVFVIRMRLKNQVLLKIKRLKNWMVLTFGIIFRVGFVVCVCESRTLNCVVR